MQDHTMYISRKILYLVNYIYSRIRRIGVNRVLELLYYALANSHLQISVFI